MTGLAFDGTTGIVNATWTTLTRPGTAVAGQLGYNSTTGGLDWYNGTSWMSVGTGAGAVATNTAVGLSALAANTTGADNVAIGVSALAANTTGARNTAIGGIALGGAAPGPYNVAVGFGAGYNTTGTASTYLGYGAGFADTSVGCNTYVGENAGYYTIGQSNTFVGAAGQGGSGYLITSGSKNTILGAYNGNQGGLDIRTLSNYIVLSDGDGNPTGYFDSNKNFIATGSSSSTGNHFLGKIGAAQGVTIFSVDNGAHDSLRLYSVSAGGFNGSATNMVMGYNTGTSRSLNAGGTINASGTDYAEYMLKAGDFTINKGDICGVNSEGKLTNVFADAISFVVKSTNPSYVGGDSWGADITDTDELEAIRQTVDRIAFAGQVPVNVPSAVPGQYIVPVAATDGSITGQAVAESDMTLTQYMKSVGKVISVDSGGTPTIIVKVA